MKYKILAIDFGERYVGLAVSNGIIARPLEVIKYPLSKYDFLKKIILKKIEIINPSIIVIGTPEKKEKKEKIKKIFLEKIFIEVFWKNKIIWVNEDYTTKEAIKLKTRKRQRDDSIAASIILEKILPLEEKEN